MSAFLNLKLSLEKYGSKISHLFFKSFKYKLENGLAKLFIKIIGKFDDNESIMLYLQNQKLKLSYYNVSS